MNRTFYYLIIISILLSLVTAKSFIENESQPFETATSSIAKPQVKRQASALATIEKCKRDREICLEGCKTVTNCTDACPVCAQIEKIPPILKPSFEIVNRNIIIDGVNGTSEQYSVQHPLTANHTTIFRLQNFINNTNLIKMPTFVNNTNVNNINVFGNETEAAEDDVGPYGFGSDESGACCMVIQPKTCRHTPSGPRCHHRRHKTCGPQCTSRSIHVQSRNRCRGRSCSHGVSYIPQPQPQCFYSNYWPFVTCGGQGTRDCGGCYDHYGADYHHTEETKCGGGCYDDGFGYGQLYRRGPVLRPFYYHEPPCYITGRCSYDMGYYSGSYGYFGGPNVDPVYGPSAGNNVYEDDDEDESNNGGTNATDWGVVVHKCRTVSENGMIKIENCVGSKENPYAASLVATEDAFSQPILPPLPYYAGYVLPPPIFNPAIDYDFYHRHQGSNLRGRSKSSTRRNKRKTRLLRRRAQKKIDAPKEES